MPAWTIAVLGSVGGLLLLVVVVVGRCFQIQYLRYAKVVGNILFLLEILPHFIGGCYGHKL